LRLSRGTLIWPSLARRLICRHLPAVDDLGFHRRDGVEPFGFGPLFGGALGSPSGDGVVDAFTLRMAKG
jgi:hypothetical protein